MLVRFFVWNVYPSKFQQRYACEMLWFVEINLIHKIQGEYLGHRLPRIIRIFDKQFQKNISFE